jgi:hypothetical protein
MNREIRQIRENVITYKEKPASRVAQQPYRTALVQQKGRVFDPALKHILQTDQN